jgi:hypothetical protein
MGGTSAKALDPAAAAAVGLGGRGSSPLPLRRREEEREPPTTQSSCLCCDVCFPFSCFLVFFSFMFGKDLFFVVCRSALH